MKKLIAIIILCFINIIIFYNKGKEVSIEKIDINLEFNELGITFLDLNDSNTLLISLNNTNILYIVDYKDSTNLKKELNRLGKSIDFIVMTKEYDIDIPAPKKIINKRLNINNIVFLSDTYNSISYNNNSLCINSSNCDFVYYTNSNIKVNNNKVLFISRNIKMNDKLYEEWVDIYKLNNSVYTVLKINDTYEVLEIIKNI